MARWVGFLVCWAGCGGKEPELWWRDLDDDQDGFPASVDCDDANVDVYPDAVELCDQADNDCDGAMDEEAVNPDDWYADLDGDLYGDPKGYLSTGCLAETTGAASNAGDCDDGDPDRNPLAEEICDNGVDENCDGSDESCA